MFVKQNTTLDEILRDLHQDYIYMNLTVHDELDVMVDKNLMTGIVYEASKVMENKDLFDRFGFVFLNVFFDFEYNKNGSFSANSSFDPIEIKKTEIYEKLSSNAIDISINSKDTETQSVEHSTIKVFLNSVSEDQLKELSSLPNGNYKLHIDLNNKENYILDRLVDLDKIVLSKYNYKLI